MCCWRSAVKKSFLVLCVIMAGGLVACSNPNADWQKANQTNTEASYQQFIQQHPNDSREAEARNRINGLQADAAWQTAQSTNTAAGYQDFLQKYPNSPHASDAQDALKKLTGYQALLASTRSKTLADKLAQSLKARYGNELQDVVVVPPTGKSKT